MSTNCDNNCEAVADLYESSVNLIQYSKQINQWVNGGQNETVNIGGVSTPTLRALAMAIKQLVGVYPDEKTITINANKVISVKLKNNGGIKYDSNGLYLPLDNSGITLDENGNLKIDFSLMPKDEFQAMLDDFRDELHLPKWLEANTTFYVRKSGSDVVEVNGKRIENKGQTIDLAFLSIQACVNYVTTNFNLDKFNATIDIGPGKFEESLNLGGYQTATGKVIVKGVETMDENDDDGNTTTIIYRKNAKLMEVTGQNYEVSNIHFKQSITSEVGKFPYGIMVRENASLTLGRFFLSVTYGDDVPADRGHRPIQIGGIMNLQNETAQASKITITGYEQGMAGLFYLNGKLTMLGANAANPDIVCSGACSIFMHVPGGEFGRNTGYTTILGFSGSMTGKRYDVLNGGHVNTNGVKKVDGVSQYFPGNVNPVASDVEASTYSWYK